MDHSRDAKHTKEPDVISVAEQLTDDTGARLFEAVSRALKDGNRRITVSLKGVSHIDSKGAAWLIQAAQTTRTSGAEFSLQNAQGTVAEFINLLKTNFEPIPPPPLRRMNLFESVGEKALSAWHELIEIKGLIINSVYWSFIAPAEGRGIRWKEFFRELDEMGFRALGIVALTNFLLGLVITMLSAAQLRLFGVQILVASLVVIGFARELAVVMTGIIVSARTGAAIAAELATMTINEEVDALRGMGLNVPKFLIAPKVLAIVIAMPILTILGFVTGVAGGFVFGVYALGFSFQRWWDQTIQAATIGDISQGFVKSFIFAAIIVVVGCHNGLRVTGGARGVGLATTRAVVMDVFFIVVADMLFATLFYFLT
jgi:phospholipid/cholesterol/gamma-HCH transport system permease protein